MHVEGVWRLVPVVAVLAHASWGCGEPEDPDFGTESQAIVGGTVTTDYPEAVLLYTTADNSGRWCSGTLLGARIVLTANHCMFGYFGPEIRVFNPSTGVSAWVTSWITYDSSIAYDLHKHDIAIGFLESRITPSRFPALAAQGAPAPSTAVRLGRVRNGIVTDSIIKAPPGAIAVNPGVSPFYYDSVPIIEGGDSGGGVFRVDLGAQTHNLIAVNANDHQSARVDEPAVVAWLASYIRCRAADGNTTSCNATVGCAYYTQNATCFPAGTPNEIAAPLEFCVTNNLNPAGCRGRCAYYTCNGTCQPRGTSNARACIDCRTLGPACGHHACAYYACNEICLVKNTPISVGCTNCLAFSGATATACDAHRDVCAYYACNQTCQVFGTPIANACADCRTFDNNFAGCGAHKRHCSWYSCNNSCWLTGTPISTVCDGGGG